MKKGKRKAFSSYKKINLFTGLARQCFQAFRSSTLQTRFYSIYFLFQNLKRSLQGRKFQNGSVVTAEQYLNDQTRFVRFFVLFFREG